MNKVVVAPTDFSPVSLNAVDYAVQWALAGNNSIWLLHVCELPVFSEIPVSQSQVERMLKEAETLMRDLRKKLMDETGGKLSISIEIKSGNVVEQIQTFCDSVNTEVVVMGAETANAFIRMMTGATTINAVEDMKWPVLVVPPDVKFNGIRNIGLACDLKEVETTIPLVEIRHLVKQFQAKLHVVHMSEATQGVFGKELITESMWLNKKIADLKPQYHFPEEADVDKGIVAFAENNHLDLLIIVPKEHSIFSRLFRHSHSKGIVLQSHVPVMAIHE
jgi:nucleotide-binding universal stress UspA family protein